MMNNTARHFAISGKIFVFLMLLTIFVPLPGSIPESINFVNFSQESGLSQNSVNCMVQDSKGFIWFATEDGLNKYDGYEFLIYRPIPANLNSLSNNSIWALLEDKNENLWVGTYNGLNCFNLRTERFYRYFHNPKNPRSLSQKQVISLLEDRDGILWVGTNGGGFCRFHRETGDFTVYKHDPKNPESLSNNVVNRMIQDDKGMLWLGTDNGLNRFDPKSGKISRFIKDTLGNTLTHQSINSILQDREKALWVGTDSGLNRIDPLNGTIQTFVNDEKNPYSISSNDIRAIFESSDGTLWIGTFEGLNVLDRQTGRFTRYLHDPDIPFTLNSNNILSIFEDRTGSIWIGFWGAGMSKFEPQRKKFIVVRRNPNMENTLSHNNVMSLYEDRQGILWIGNRGNGFDRFDRRNNLFTNFRHIPGNPNSLPHNTIRAIYEDPQGILWLGTYGGGLSRFDRAKNQFTNFQEIPDDPESLSNNQIRAILLDRRGQFWIGTDGGGLNLFNQNTGKFKRYMNNPNDPYSLSNDRVMKILEDSVGRLWICTFGGGLNLYDPVKDNFVSYKNDPDDPKSLAMDYVVTIFEDSSHQLWLGTDGAGIEKFNPEKGIFYHFLENSGLPNKTIYIFLEDSLGNLWFTHNLGISRMDPDTETFKNYSIQDGLQGSEFIGNSGYKNPWTGEMFFGGLNGFNSFFPERITDNPAIPPVIITRFQLFNQTITPATTFNGRRILERSIQDTKEITLSYRDRVIAFEFTALNFISPEKNQYAYMMEGFDKNWNFVEKRRFASYTALPGGNYVFRVKGSNNDGVWNETGASITIHITPPFWKTWWFITLSTILGISATLSIYRYRIRSLTKSKMELEHLVQVRTQELKEISLLDPLTGLRNRRFISEILKDDTEAFLKKKQFLLHNPNKRVYGDFLVYGIMMIDIDHFKTINDQYGHDMGDRWLTQLAGILKRSIRGDDEVIRFGGEEFLVILKNTNVDYIERIALKIKEEATRIDLAVHNKELKRSCSIGYTQFPFYVNSPDKITFEKALLLADLGLYYAKQNGRNMAVHIIPQQNIPEESQILQMTTSIEYGIENNFYKIKPSI